MSDRKPPSKSQKAGSLKERMAKLNATAKSDESWRAKLAERDRQNARSPTPSETKEDDDGGTEDAPSGPPSLWTARSSQRAIIERLAGSAAEWRSKRQNEGDAMLQALRQKNAASKQHRKNMAEEHQRRVALEAERWRLRAKGPASAVKVDLSAKVAALESKEAEWASRYSSTARRELEDQALRANVHDAVNANIDRFLDIAQSEKEDPNAWRRRLQVGAL